MQGETQHGSFLMGYNSEAHQSLWSGKDMAKVLTNGYNMNAFTYSNHYLRRFKENLKQTMLEHESVFEDQIHELHRLYWRQKELMVEMEGTTSHSQPRHPESFYPIAGFAQSLYEDFPTTFQTTSVPWMNSSISTPRLSISPQEEPSCRIKAGLFGTDYDKSGKKVLDLGLPAYEYLDIGEERVSHDGESHEAPNSGEPMESDFQFDKLQHLSGSSKLKCMLDLNEPAEIEEPLEFELKQFANPVAEFCAASNSIVGESESRNDGGNSENGSHGLIEVQDQLLSIKCQTENGIDLNMSPLSSEEIATIPGKIESEQHQESFSSSSHIKQGLGRSRVVVQALPCSRGMTSLQKGSKPFFRSSRAGKKAKRGTKSRVAAAICSQSRTRKGSDLDSSFDFNDDDHLPSTASYIPGMDLQERKDRTQTDGKSDYNQARGRKRKSCSLANFKSVRNSESRRTKKSRTKLQNMRSFLATEEDDPERAAAEAIVGISSSIVHAGTETSAHTPCNNLHWFAMIASSVVEDSKSECGLSLSDCHHASGGTDGFEAMTLQLRETEVEEHNSLKKSNTADHRAVFSNISHGGKHRKGWVKQGKRRYKKFQREVLPRVDSFPRNEVCEDIQTMGSLMEATKTKWNQGCSTNKIKNGISTKGRRRACDSPHEPIDATVTASCNRVEERKVPIDWGRVTRGRRGPRVPAASFQLVLSQV